MVANIMASQAKDLDGMRTPWYEHKASASSSTSLWVCASLTEASRVPHWLHLSAFAAIATAPAVASCQCCECS
jgi:hypothetical protein